jgi:hypothetical protein
VGIALENYAISGLGAVYMIIGLVNKKKWGEGQQCWSEMTPEQKKVKIWIIAILGLLVVLGLVAFFLLQ